MKTMPEVDPRCRLLLVDDDPDSHDLVAGILAGQGIEVVWAIDGVHAVEIARREAPDLILLDYEMPGANGVEVLSRLRLVVASESTPVVFITASDSHKVLTECFQAGAADYIRKPFCAPELRARVRTILDRKQMLAQLKRLALHDSLTGLCNRASICDRIQSAIHHAQSRNCAVFYLDFDRFKLVNDSLGHDVGDLLLQGIANRLRGTLRNEDSVGFSSSCTTAARLGGDEFVVLLENLHDRQEAIQVAGRLLTALAVPYSLGSHQVSSTASIGVVDCLRPYTSSDEVLRDADMAMYAAKSAGKGRVILFDQALHLSQCVPSAAGTSGKKNSRLAYAVP